MTNRLVIQWNRLVLAPELRRMNDIATKDSNAIGNSDRTAIEPTSPLAAYPLPCLYGHFRHCNRLNLNLDIRIDQS